ncbi:hypothetical protein [Methanobrevibacter sp.]
MKKILKILIGISLLFLLIGAVNAADNSTKQSTVQDEQIDTPDSYNGKPIIWEDQSSQVSKNNQKTVQNTATKAIKCKVKTHDIKRRQGKNIQFAVWIKDNKNKPVDNLKLKLKRVYKGHSYTSYIRTISGEGIKFYSNLGSGKHKIYITSANPKYKVSATSTITIGNGKLSYVGLKIRNPNSYPAHKKGISAYYTFGGQNNPGVYATVDGRGSWDGYIHKKIVSAMFYFKNNKNSKLITKKVKGHTNIYVSTAYYHLINGYTPVYAKVWYTPYNNR